MHKLNNILSKRSTEMEALVWETAEELDKKVAEHLRNIRKRRQISQRSLADLSGVSYGSVKRFETTGQISLLSLTKIAVALNIADDLRNIFIKYILLAERNIKSSLSYHFCKEYGDLQSDYLNVNNYERLQIPKEKGRYTYGKNDLYAQVIILKLLLSTEDFHKFFHDLKMCFKKHSIHKEILGKMGFPENWQRIGRIKNYIKSEIL